jgi:hypothetical protein
MEDYFEDNIILVEDRRKKEMHLNYTKKQVLLNSE